MRTKRKYKNSGKKTCFSEIIEDTKREAVEVLWKKSKQTSNLRHLAVQKGKRREACLLGDCKEQLIDKVIKTLPEDVEVAMDCDYQVGLPSVYLRGHGRQHLPANTKIV